MNEFEKVELEKMRKAIDRMTGSHVEMLNHLPSELSATTASVEHLIRAWDGVSENKNLSSSPMWNVLLELSNAIRAGMFDLDRRLSSLERASEDGR